MSLSTLIAAVFVTKDVTTVVADDSNSTAEQRAEEAWLADAEGHAGTVYLQGEDCWFIQVVSEYGEVFSHGHVFKVQADADAFRSRVEARLLGTSTDDLREDCWRYDRVMYGTAAYLGETAMMSPRQLAGEPV